MRKRTNLSEEFGAPLTAEGGENMLRKKKGQSTMEYIILFAAVVAAIIAFAYMNLKGGVQKMQQEAGNKILEAADKFAAEVD